MAEQQNIQIYLIIAVAIVAMLLMAGAIIIFVVFYQKKMINEQLKRQTLEFDYQQRMMQAELESQESERRKLAADLHDSIGGMLSTIRMGISTLARTVPEPNNIQQTKQMLDDTISSVRRISRDLMPSTLEKFGLTHALKELCDRFQGTSGIAIDYQQPKEIPTLEKTRELMVFRIAQELLNNAIKHARANQIIVSLDVEEHLTLSVEDDGIGFDAAAQKQDNQSGKGLGLFNIENRTTLLEGRLSYDENREKGSKTTLTLPIHYEPKA